MITVIVPCFNCEEYICECIESILSQSKSVDEILLVDDCSTDSTRNLIKRYPVTLLSTACNSGHAAARNIGIRHAKGDLLAWLDADDFWDSNHIETVASLLDLHPDASVAFSGIRMFGTQCGEWVPTSCLNSPKFMLSECFSQTVVPAMSVITRREPLLQIGGFDETIRIAPDFDLWLRLSEAHLFICTDQITANYRKHDSQISSTPHRQNISVHQSRIRFISKLRKEGQMNLGEQLEERLGELWTKDVRLAWDSRQMNWVRELLALAHSIHRPSTLPNYIHAKKFLQLVQEQQQNGRDITKEDILQCAKKPWFIPETTTLFEQLQSSLLNLFPWS